MERAAARAFLDRSLAFVGAVRARPSPVCARGRGAWQLTQAVDAAVGPFPAFTHELAASVRAHLAEDDERTDRLSEHGAERYAERLRRLGE